MDKSAARERISLSRSPSAQDSRDLWDREYADLLVIPSSARQSPAKALTLLSELLGLDRLNRALDLGCGTGRNTVYLAQKGVRVDAIDDSLVALGTMRRLVDDLDLRHLIRVHERHLQDPFPFPDGTFDLVLDSYVFCHFTDHQMKVHFLNEAQRVLNPNGRFVSILFSPEDAYYKQFPLQIGHVVTDPNNGITKVLYTEKELRALFGSIYEFEYLVKFEFDDMVMGRTYTRCILTSVLRK